MTVEATLEHPFFVFGQGWSSCEPERSLHRYGLDCQRLSVGDVCISLTHKDVQERAAEISLQQQELSKDSPHRASALRNSTSSLSPAHKGASPSDVEGRPRKHHLSSLSSHHVDSQKDNVEVKRESPHYSVTWCTPSRLKAINICVVMLLHRKKQISSTLPCLIRLLILLSEFKNNNCRDEGILFVHVYFHLSVMT